MTRPSPRRRAALGAMPLAIAIEIARGAVGYELVQARRDRIAAARRVDALHA